MKKLIPIFFLCCFSTTSYTQIGTDFWLAPPDVTDLHNPPGGEPLYLYIQSQAVTDAMVTISQPANPGFNGGSPIVITVNAGKTNRVNLTPFKAALETRPTNAISNTGLRIQSNMPVSVQYEIANTNNTDIISLKGDNALGNYFYIPFHKHAPFSNHTFSAPHTANTTFDIVATQNNTIIKIYSPVSTDGHPPLQQFGITMNAGQTYSAGFTGTNYEQPSTHLSGAVLLSDKPVAITLKSDAEHNPSGACSDLQAEQIVPVSRIGNEYIAIKGSLNNTGDESVILMGTVNGTDVFLDGAATPVVTLFSGEYYRIDMDYLAASANNAVFIHATQPVYAMHYTGFGCEMGDALLPPLNYGTTSINFSRGSAESYYINLVCRTTNVNNFTITGPGTATISPASFKTVPGTGGAYMAASIQFNTTQVPVDSTFNIQNSTGAFHLGLLNGGASTGARYTYLSPFGVNGSLPLRMLQLSGRRQQDGNYLEWTAGEDGEQYRYDLQIKQSNGWTTIETKQSGSIASDRSYNYLHRSQASGPLVYRVAATELSTNRVLYSNCVLLNRNNSGAMMVYPNPASEKITVQLSGTTGSIRATIYSIAGETISMTYPTTNTFTIAIKDLPRGVYMLKVTDSNNQWQEKITKQ
jgi:hypothetical protein